MRIGRVAWIALAGMLVLTACTPRLSPEEQQRLAELKQQAQSVREEILQTQKAQQELGDGLLKVLGRMRLEVLKTSESLVDQRIHALEAGAKVTVVVPITSENPTRAGQLMAEMQEQKKKLEQAEAQAGRYSGGLLQAMALMSVATTKNTISMLEQQYLIAKYGLAPVGPIDPTK